MYEDLSHGYSQLIETLGMALIILISTSELTLVFIITRTLNLNFIYIVGIGVQPLFHVPNNILKYYN